MAAVVCLRKEGEERKRACYISNLYIEYLIKRFSRRRISGENEDNSCGNWGAD